MVRDNQTKVSINGRDASELTQEEIEKALASINTTLSNTLGGLNLDLSNLLNNTNAGGVNPGNLIPTIRSSGENGNMSVDLNGSSLVDLNLAEIINDALRGRS